MSKTPTKQTGGSSPAPSTHSHPRPLTHPDGMARTTRSASKINSAVASGNGNNMRATATQSPSGMPRHATSSTSQLTSQIKGRSSGAASAPRSREAKGTIATEGSYEQASSADEAVAKAPKARKAGKRSSSPLKKTAMNSELTPSSAPTPVAAVDQISLLPSTPDTVKSTRARAHARSSRQVGPPVNDEAEDLPASPDSHVADFPQPGLDISILSSSAPTRNSPLARHANSLEDSALAYQQARHSAADDWDMPSAPRTSHEILTWQQSLKQDASPSFEHSVTRSKSARAVLPQMKKKSEGRGAASKTKANNRPILSGSQSDSAPSTSTGSALTWQQELLQQSDSGSMYHQKNVSGSPSKVSAAKLRRQLQKDDETFGLGGMNLNEQESRIHYPVQANHTASAQKPRNSKHDHQYSQPPMLSTPSKPAESRYAGPTFHNSPAPSSLPTPSFLLRRQQTMEVPANGP